MESEIRERAVASRFYRFRPIRITLIDNTVRFGFHAELKFKHS